VFNHIIDQIYNIGFQPVITVVDPRYELASEKLAKLASEVDGMIVLSSLLRLDGVKEALSDAPYRCVAAPYKIPEELGFSSVSAEIFNSCKIIVDYLISKGHRKIIMLTDERDTARFAGAEKSFKEHGIDFSSASLFNCRGYRHCGYERFGELLNTGMDFTAVVCQNDSCALGVIERCMKERLDVPANISIIGFDNIPDSARFPVPLTTAGIDLKQMSKVIVNRLFEGIRTEKVQLDVEINTQFIERESVCQL
jgi:LacI family transcriptional regulator